MGAQQMDFRDSETAATTVFSIFDVLKETVQARDKESLHCVLVLLTQAAAGVVRLLCRRRSGIRTARVRVGLGAALPPDRWRDMGPEEILKELYEFKEIEQAFLASKQERIKEARTADQKRLSAQIQRILREMKASVRAARTWIVRHWPDYWTQKEEDEFQGYL